MRVGINGAGRIGRTLLRIAWQRGRHTIVHINELNSDLENVAYLLRHDSTYGRFPAQISLRDRCILIEDDRHAWSIACTSQNDSRDVPWRDSDVVALIESTGVDHNARACSGLIGGPTRHAIITQASNHAESTIVIGVNSERLQSRPLPAVLAASTCDAIAIAPVIKVFLDRFGIEHAFITTLHPWLSYQNLLDGFVGSLAGPGRFTGGYELGRASPGAIIPKPTSIGQVVTELIPSLKDRLTAVSYRLPTAVVCYADLAMCLGSSPRRDQILDSLRAIGPFVRLSDEPLVSVDFEGEEASAVIDTRWLYVAQNGHVKLTLVYDNEWGYACRLHDLLDALDTVAS